MCIRIFIIRLCITMLHHKSRTGFRSVFIMSAGDGLRPERPCAFPNPRADAIGPRQQSLFRRKAPYESPHLHQTKPKTNHFECSRFRFFFLPFARHNTLCSVAEPLVYSFIQAPAVVPLGKTSFQPIETIDFELRLCYTY